MTTIKDLQAKYLTKLESKTKGGITKRTLSKNLGEFDGDNDGFVSFNEFWRSLERAGNALSSQEAEFLFSFWDTRAGQQDPCGYVPVALAVDDLLSSQEQYTSVMFKSGVDKMMDSPTKGGNQSNRSSQQGGIFGGGAYSADAAGGGYGAPPPSVSAPVAQFEMAAAQEKPRGNQSSIAGGIFGEADQSAPPSSRGGGNKSNKSSIEGGIFGTAMENMPMQPRANKPYSNASSIPGGIFG